MAAEHLTTHPEPVPAREALAPGKVRAVTGRAIAIERRGVASVARRAASCLLAPRAGDLVLCADLEGVTYVLAVLEREGDAVELDVEGDLSLRSRSGSIELDAAETARVRAKALAFLAEESSWIGRELRLLGEQLTLDATRIRQVSTFAERAAETVRERFGHACRDVEEAEHVRAGTSTLSVRGLLRQHAETALTSAKKLIKLDGQQIQLG